MPHALKPWSVSSPTSSLACILVHLISVIPVGAPKRLSQEPARSRPCFLAQQQPTALRKPLKRKRKLKRKRAEQRSKHARKDGARQTDCNVTESVTDRSNRVDYALAKQLCSLQKKAHILCSKVKCQS